MKTKKKILTSLFVILAVIGIGAGIAIMYLGTIVAKGMRSFGTEATGTKLAVESVYISLLNGDLQINKLAIDNPANYKSREAFSFDLVSVDLDVGSIFTDTIIVNKIKIANLKVNFEPTIRGGSNLTDIKNNIMKFAKNEEADAQKETGPEEAPETDAEPKKAKKIIIKSFIVDKGEIMVSSGMLKTSISVPLPRLELNDIGEESAVGKAFAKIFDKIIEQIVMSVASANIEGLSLDKLKSTLLKDLPASGIGKNISKTLKDLF